MLKPVRNARSLRAGGEKSSVCRHCRPFCARYAEFGSVWLPEIIALRGHLGLPVERDLSFELQGRISAYIKASQAEGRIVEQLPEMA